MNAMGEVIGIHHARSANAERWGGPKDRNLGLAVKSSVMYSEVKYVLLKEALQENSNMESKECNELE